VDKHMRMRNLLKSWKVDIVNRRLNWSKFLGVPCEVCGENRNVCG
jgi:hypothetical protein